MLETTVSQLVRDTSQTKYYVIFPDIVFDKISCSSSLTANEKLVWLNIARKIIREPQLSLVLTYQQLAEMVGLKLDTAYRVVKELKDKGFLQSSTDTTRQRVTYTIGLPEDILFAIENAPNRAKGEGREKVKTLSTTQLSSELKSEFIKMENGIGTSGETSSKLSDIDPIAIGSISDSPPDQNPILLININNINKKHDHEGLVEAESSSDVLGLKNAEALVREFESFQKQYQHFAPVERMRRVNSHFNQEEMKLILTALTERQREEESNQCREVRESRGLNSEVSKEGPIASSQAQHGLNECVEFNFDGESFLVAEDVKARILKHIPDLYQQRLIKGEAAGKPLKALMTEIFYYVTKVGNRILTSDEQLKRFYVARKICLSGGWEKPRGMTLNGIINKENSWKAIKSNEISSAMYHLTTLGCLQ